jgi:hypothetical protein
MNRSVNKKTVVLDKPLLAKARMIASDEKANTGDEVDVMLVYRWLQENGTKQRGLDFGDGY